MVGLYRVPNVVVFGGFGNIPHGALCHCGVFIVAVPGTRERNCEKIFLAIDIGRNYRRRPGNIPGIIVLSHPALLARHRCKKFRIQSAKFNGCVHHRWTTLITWPPPPWRAPLARGEQELWGVNEKVRRRRTLYYLFSMLCALKMRRWRIFYSIQIAAYVVAFCPPTGIFTLPLVTETLPSVWDTSVTTAPVPDDSESSPLIASVTAFCVIAPSVF